MGRNALWPLLLLVPTGLACSDEGATTTGGTTSSTTSGGAGGGGASGSTTGTGAGEPGWSPVPWWDGNCPLQMADDPESAFPPLEWGVCPANEVGCEMLVKNWPQRGPTAVAQPAVLRTASGYIHSLYVGLPDYEVRVPIIEVDGRASMVYRTPPNPPKPACVPLLAEPYQSGHWFGNFVLGSQPKTTYVFQPVGLDPADALVLPPLGPNQQKRSSELLMAIQYDFGVAARIYDRQTGLDFQSPDDMGATLPWLTDDAGFLLLVPSPNEPEAWVWTREREQYEPLITPAMGHVVDVKADGERLIWIQTPPKAKPGSGEWPAGTLYSSPYTTVQDEVVPTALRPMPPTGPGPESAIGGGHYALYSAYTNLLYIVRLSDGRQWVMPIPLDEFGALLNNVSYVDDTYVYFKTGTNIFRQRLDALGPGEPPP